jgi:membrane-associated phospholipid phosphatase
MQFFPLCIGAQPLLCASIDQTIAFWFRSHLTPAFSEFLLGLTTAGSEIAIAGLVLATLGWLVWRRHWLALATLLLTVPCGALLGEAIKLVVQRPRPFLAGPFGVWGGYSFPSGHTLGATLMYGFLMFVLLPLFRSRRWRLLVAAVGAAIIAGVAFSRVALGAHYLTDVMGAMALGTIWLMIAALLARVIARHMKVALQTVAATGRLRDRRSEIGG